MRGSSTLGDQSAAQLQTQELARIEQVPVVGGNPIGAAGRSSSPGGIASSGTNRGESRSQRRAASEDASQIFGIGLLEEAALVPCLSKWIVVLDGEQPMRKRAAGGAGIGIGVSATRALATSAAGRSCPVERACTGRAGSGPLAILDLVEVATHRTHQDVFRVASILRQQVAGKQIDGRPAGFAIEHLDPQKRLHRHVRVPVTRAGGSVVVTDLGAQPVHECTGGLLVGRKVESGSNSSRTIQADIGLMSKPSTSHPTRFASMSGVPPTHERVGDPQSGKVVGSKEEILQATLAELREHEAPEQGARAAREPLVNSDDGAVVLLDLLLSKRHFGDQGHIEAPLDTHQ